MDIKKVGYTIIGNGLRCHDSYIVGFECDFENHSIQICLSDSPFTNVQHLVFKEVVCFRVTGYEPWGHDSCIFDWQYLEFEEAENVFKDVLEDIGVYKGGNGKGFVFSEFVFKSGDRISIACETVFVDSSLIIIP